MLMESLFSCFGSPMAYFLSLAVDYSAHVGHTFMSISGDKEGLY